MSRLKRDAECEAVESIEKLSMKPRCDECKCFVKDYRVMEDLCDGECRRYPPKAKERTMVMQHDWCGEFQGDGEKRDGW